MTESDMYLRHCNKTIAKAALRSKSRSRKTRSRHHSADSIAKKGQSFVQHYEKISIEDTYDSKLFEDYLILLQSLSLTGVFSQVLVFFVHCRRQNLDQLLLYLRGRSAGLGMKLCNLLPLIAGRRGGIKCKSRFR